MSGGQLVRAQSQSRVQQGPEFHGPVAECAGIGRAPFRIGAGKGIDDLTLKDGAQVHCMQGDVQSAAGGFQTRQGVGGSVGAGGGLLRQKKTVQGQDVVTGPAQQEQGAKTVHAAADGNGDPGAFLLPSGGVKRHF